MSEPVDHFKSIYAHHASDYHRMIAVEDVDGNLRPAILHAARRQDFHSLRILDVGSGTGRIPLLLRNLPPDKAPAEVVALDLSFAMLREQRLQADQLGEHWPLVQADGRGLPVTEGWADLVLAGWAIGHLRGWYEQDWKDQISQILFEMLRAARSGGTLVILETLTTGSLVPAPPTPGLAEYYAWLEGEWGFQRQTIATDYQFESIEQAVVYTEFFFGPELSAAIRDNGWVRLPEWTGVWSRGK